MKRKANFIIFVLTTIIIIVVIASLNLLKQSNINDSDEEMNIKIKSKILKEVIENNWNKDYDFGTKESTFDHYDIYFDEGIEVKNVDNNIYNIVLTDKYEKNVVNSIKTTDNLEDIISELGQPDFGGKSIGLIGYKLEDIYIFFNGMQASIYRNINHEVYFVNTYTTKFDFINSITKKWQDYDIYTLNSTDDYVQFALINYAYKGIRISVIDDEIEIIVYNNCNVKIPENGIYKISTKNKNLIYEVESERQQSIHNREFVVSEYNSYIDELTPGLKDEIEEETELKNKKSNKFIALQRDFTTSGEYKLLFVSVDGNLPNSEIDEYIISNMWVDNYNIVYSIINKGIYLYNVKTQEKKVVKEGNETFLIQGITDNNKLQYDDKQISLNI